MQLDAAAQWQAEREQWQAAGTQMQREVQQLRAQLEARQSSSRRLKGPTPPEFSGLKQSLHGREIEAFIRDMGKCFSYDAANFPTDASKVEYATFFLKAAAGEWWEKLSQSHGAQCSWEQFTKALRGRYGNRLAAEAAREQLFQLKQTGGLSAYCDHFLKLLTAVSDMSEADQVHLFVRGLKRAELALEVRRAQPTTLNSAMNEAVRADAFLAGSRKPVHHYRGGAGPSSSDATPMDLNAIDAQEDAGDGGDANEEADSSQHASILEQVVSRMEKLEHRLAAVSSGKPFGGAKKGGGASAGRVPGLSAADVAQLRAEGKCFRCKKTGHLKRECPLLNGKQNFQ